MDAYRKRGWKYRDLCRPLLFEGVGGFRSSDDGNDNDDDDGDDGHDDDGSDGNNDVDAVDANTAIPTATSTSMQPDPDDIRHPQWFYGFWGQCFNDYRKVCPHEGYDIVARWGRDKNFSANGCDDDAVAAHNVCSNENKGSAADGDDNTPFDKQGGNTNINNSNSDDANDKSVIGNAATEEELGPYDETGASMSARQMRRIIYHLEKNGDGKVVRNDNIQDINFRKSENDIEEDSEDKDVWVDDDGHVWMEDDGDDGDDNNDDKSDDSNSFNDANGNNDEESEPYYVSPHKRAGAFFLFTSNVDAHSYDVFQSHEIRECHGNVELWQCSNFACGTNDSLLDSGDSGGACGDNSDDRDDIDDDKQPQQEKRGQRWQRRLWRLPKHHHFLVDRNTMSAPRFKHSQETLTGATKPPPSSSAAASMDESFYPCPSPKRRKSSSMDVDDTVENNKGNGSIPNNLRDSNDCISSKTDAPTSLLSSEAAPAHVGDVHGRPRLNPLQYMYPSPPAIGNTVPSVESNIDNNNGDDHFLPLTSNENWPTCPRCHLAARPAVLMFEDLDWVYNLKQEARWQCWCHSLLKLCKERGGHSLCSHDNSSRSGNSDVDHFVRESSNIPHGNKSLIHSLSEKNRSPPTPLKVCILEIGCGYNVPTCRMISEALTSQLSMHGGDVNLVRINPFHPEADDSSVENQVVSIMEKGLVALKQIDEAYQQLRSGSTQE